MMWTNDLLQWLCRPDSDHRLVILGMGNDLFGDDSAGVLVARALQPLARGQPDVLVLDGGAMPENFVGCIEQFSPHQLLLIDALRAGDAPGTICVVSPEHARSGGLSTHRLSLTLLTTYLQRQVGCPTRLVGIQPEIIALDAPVSASVRASVAVLVSSLYRWVII